VPNLHKVHLDFEDILFFSPLLNNSSFEYRYE
jgi:hypothetical protein